MIMNLRSEYKNILLVYYVYEYYIMGCFYIVLEGESIPLFALRYIRLSLIIRLENFASGFVYMNPVRLTFSYSSIFPCACK